MRVLVFTMVGALCAIGHAEPTATPWSVGVSETDKAAAGELLEHGNVLFLEKNYTGALTKYREAVAVWDHPAIRFNIVRCLIQLDRPVEAVENLQTTLRYGAAPLEEAVYTEALAYEKLLAKQIGELSIECNQKGVVVTLDGQPFATCPARTTQRIAPGRHQVLGTGGDLVPRATEVFVTGGEAQSLVIQLESPPQQATGLSARSYGKLALVGGVGVVAVAGGLGLWAWRSYRSQFPTHCMESSDGPPLCDASGVEVLDRARVIGDASTVVAAVGGVAIITGALLLWRFPRKEHGMTVVPAAKGAGLAIQGAF